MPPPDADLFPHATGPAQAIVNKHTTDEPLVLYAGWFCPFVQRVWAVLEEKSIPYKYVEVNPYHKQPEFLALNPRGLVPTLEYNKKPLYESTVVVEFLEEAFPMNAPRLLPDTPLDRAISRIWMDFVTSRIIPAFHKFLQHQEGQSPLSLEEARQGYLDKLKEFTVAMDKSGPYFSGKEPSLVDFALAPWAIRHWAFDHFKDGGLGIPAEGQGGDDEHVWTRWRRWYSAIRTRPSLKETTSDREHYLPIYQRYHENKAQSELAKATRQGGGVP